jgi:hypothetical protein
MELADRKVPDRPEVMKGEGYKKKMSAEISELIFPTM